MHTNASQIDSNESLVARFRRDGFVSIPDLLGPHDLEILRAAFDEAVASGDIEVDGPSIHNLNDAIYRHPTFEATAKDPRICKIVEAVLGVPIELQHSKFMNKPEIDDGQGHVKWHQDFAFFPHTNADLAAVGIHLDAEDSSSGPVRVISGSHQWGPLSHCRDGEFVYECTEERPWHVYPSEELVGPAGHVTIHHCLAMHCSSAKSTRGPRRVLYLQYRAQDAVQMAGVVWRCTGYSVADVAPIKGMARFFDGTRVELRGVGSRIYDPTGQLAPDTEGRSHSIAG